MKTIDSFSGEFRFLSNFQGGVEQEYQAAKCRYPDDANKIRAMSPGQAKRQGRRVSIRSDWENVKLQIMEQLLREKFQNEPFRAQLLSTGDAELIEGNTWGDTFWGVCEGRGDNHLGKLLMKIRQELRGVK